MKNNNGFDFWYAVQNTEIVVPPQKRLETFGNTLLHYHLVSESMDDVNKVKVRTGRMQMLKPQIITPQAYSKMIMEGFGEEASKYMEWLRENEESFRVLRYGYTLRQESFSENLITDSLDAVLDRVKTDVTNEKDPFAAVIKGVDDPWDVCLVRLFWFTVQQSAQENIAELAKSRMFEIRDGLPYPIRQQIEKAFDAAASDPDMIKPLGRLLQENDVFDRFEDRFFAVVQSHRSK